MTGSSDQTSREGVEAVRLALVQDLGWYPREPSAPDYGVDLYVECATDGIPNGRLLGLQIKSGSSFFRERSNDSVVFRGSRRHLEYWLGHSLPIVVVLYDPTAKTSIWQAVTRDAVSLTRQGWKMLVPRAQVLDVNAQAHLAEIAEDDEYTLRLNALRADKSWMSVLGNGGRVLLDVGEWINKSSGRGSLRLTAELADGTTSLERSREVYLGSADYAESLPLLFPWAELDIDEETYEAHDRQRWELEEGIYDSEDDRVLVVGLSFQEWREQQGQSGLRPYEVAADEVAQWRLTLELNPLGQNFLALDQYLSGRGEPERY